MIIDTSAAVAIIRNEDDADRMIRAAEQALVLKMSAASVLELAMVLGPGAHEIVDDFIAAMGIRVLPVDEEQLSWARVAFERFGRSSGSPARLNFGDCLTYGAARATGEPLLYVGGDFGHTDLELAAL